MSFLMVKVLISWIVFTLATLWVNRERSIIQTTKEGTYFCTETRVFAPSDARWVHLGVTVIHLCVFLYALCEWSRP